MEFTFYEQTNKSEKYLYIIDSFSAHKVLSKPFGLFKCFCNNVILQRNVKGLKTSERQVVSISPHGIRSEIKWTTQDFMFYKLLFSV